MTFALLVCNKDKVDSSFDKYLNNYLTNNKIHGVFISTRDQQCYVIGEKKIVNQIKADSNMLHKSFRPRSTKTNLRPTGDQVETNLKDQIKIK